MTDADLLRLFAPILAEAKAMKFGSITATFTIRNGEPYGAEIIEARKRWTMQDVPKRESVLE